MPEFDFELHLDKRWLSFDTSQNLIESAWIEHVHGKITKLH